MIFKRILIFLLITITAALFVTGCTPSLFAPPLNAYVITSTASTGGSINPGGEVVVIEGQDKTFTIIPDEGYQVSDVLVDGISVGVVNSYTFPSVDDFHAIQANFTIIAPRVVNIDTGIEYNSIQKAIDDALSGQTLVAYPAIYKGIIFIDKNITLRSTDPLDSSVVASTVIEGRYGPL